MCLCTGATELPQLEHEVTYEGRPVQTIGINIKFPEQEASTRAAAPFGASSAADVSQAMSTSSVEVCNGSIRVVAPGFLPLEVSWWPALILTLIAAQQQLQMQCACRRGPSGAFALVVALGLV